MTLGEGLGLGDALTEADGLADGVLATESTVGFTLGLADALPLAVGKRGVCSVRPAI